MWEAAVEALSLIMEPSRLIWLISGVGIGLLIGIIPGMGGAVGMSILLPFLFGVDPLKGIALLIGMTAVVHTSDTFPSVLMGIPGSGGSQATVMDGYPLAQEGEGARALGAAFFASMVGGLIGAASVVVTIPIIRSIVLAIGTPEFFMLALLGLAMVGIVSRSSMLAGLLSSLLGVFIGLVGAAPATAQYRFTLGWFYLYDGIPIVVVALGVFAIPEMTDLLIERRSVARALSLGGGRLDGVRDAIANKWLVLWSALLGTTVGAIPGLGGHVVGWLAYGLAKQTSRDPERFGKGDIRGVIAPESANNAIEAGALIPTMLFGIPGSAITAILLGGLVLLGIQPGPRMVTTDLATLLAMMWTLAIANVLAAALCFALSRQVSKLSLVRASRLVPFLLALMFIASYQATEDWGDIIVLLVLGAFAWVMKQLSWPRAPVIIGYVLAAPIERNLFVSMNLFGLSWLTRPWVIVIGVLIVLLLFGGLGGSVIRGKREMPRDTDREAR